MVCYHTPIEEEENQSVVSKTSSYSFRHGRFRCDYSYNARRNHYPEWTIESAARSAPVFERQMTIKRLPGPVRHKPFLPEWRRPPERHVEAEEDAVKPRQLQVTPPPEEERLIGAMRIERKIKMPSSGGAKSKGTYIGSNPSDILSCCYSAQANQLATGCADGTVFIFSTVPGSLFGDMLHNFRKIVAPLEPPSLLDACTRVRWHPKPNKEGDSDILMASYARGFLRYWHAGEGYPPDKRNIATIESEDGSPFQSFSVNPVNEDRIAIACENEILVYDEATLKLIRKLKGDRSDKLGEEHPLLKISQVKYHPRESTLLVSGGWDKALHIWDEREPKRSIRQIHGPCVCGESIDIDEGNNLAVGSWRRHDNVEIFDFGSGRRIASIVQTPSRDLPIVQPYVCKWQGKNGLIVGGSHSNGLKVIDRRDNCVISSMQNVPNPIVCIDQLSKRPECPVAAGAGNCIYFIKVNWKQLETKE